MTREEAADMLRHCEAESHCYDGIHGNCKRCNKRIAFDMAIEALKDRPKGEWVKRKVKEHQFIQNGYVLYYCSECGVEKKIGWANGVNFCPNCGADMRGEDK